MLDPAAVAAPPYSQMVSPGVPSMQMLNVNNILNVKDSRWLQLEVCREFQRNKCIRQDTECKFAHPPANVEVQNGRVTACYDSIKSRCHREKPPCKFFHPPQHLKDQLLINGRNHLAYKNAFLAQIQGVTPGAQLVPNTLPVQPSSPYMPNIHAMGSYNPYVASSQMVTIGMTEPIPSPITGVLPQSVIPAQKMPRLDRIEPYPGVGMPSYKRTAHDKSGMPVYQPATANAAYHQALMQHLGTQPYVPVTCEYGRGSPNLALPPPNAEANSTSHTPPAIHNASSSSSASNVEALASDPSVSHTTAPFSPYPASSTALVPYSKASSIHQQSVASPTIQPPPPMNALSYALNKAISGQAKPASIPISAASASNSAAVAAAMAAGGAVQYALPQSQMIPGTLPTFPLGVGLPQAGVGHQINPAYGLASGIGPYVQQGVPMFSGLPGIGASVPSIVTPQLVYPNHSSFVYPQLTALPSHQQYSLTQSGGEQPYKKLKTS